MLKFVRRGDTFDVELPTGYRVGTVMSIEGKWVFISRPKSFALTAEECRELTTKLEKFNVGASMTAQGDCRCCCHSGGFESGEFCKQPCDDCDCPD